MKRSTIRTIITLATISLIGVVAIQIFWVKKAFSIQEKQFNDQVYLSLRDVAKQIKVIYKDSSEMNNPVHQAASNYFIANINDTLHPYLLETLLKKEFTKRNIKADFDYIIYDCFTDSIAFGNYISLTKTEKSNIEETSKKMKWGHNGHYFGVYFPGKTTYLISHMGIWTFTSFLILLIITFFSYTINVILRQKRLSEIKTDFINNMTH